MQAAKANYTQHLQQVVVCARKMRQPKPGSRRNWARFGRYLERDNANPERSGFTPEQDSQVPISDQLREWQRTGGDRVVSVILSPENELDLKEFTRAWIARIEREYGASLDWIAAVHTNTEHPHVHVVFKGKNRDIQFSRTDLHEDFRRHAREIATEFLGYRNQKPEQERSFARKRSQTQEREDIR